MGIWHISSSRRGRTIILVSRYIGGGVVCEGDVLEFDGPRSF